MAGRDHQLELRRAIITFLANSDDVIAITGDRIYGEQAPANPAWPFIRYGFPFTAPFEASCWDGSEHDIIIHAFAKGPGTDTAAILAKAIVAALSGQDDDIIDSDFLLLEGDQNSGSDHLAFEGDQSGALLLEEAVLDFEMASLDWIDTQIVRDTDEAGAFHAVIRFNCKTFETVAV